MNQLLWDKKNSECSMRKGMCKDKFNIVEITKILENKYLNSINNRTLDIKWMNGVCLLLLSYPGKYFILDISMIFHVTIWHLIHLIKRFNEYLPKQWLKLDFSGFELEIDWIWMKKKTYITENNFKNYFNNKYNYIPFFKDS